MFEDKTPEEVITEINSLIAECWAMSDQSVLPNTMIIWLSGRKLKKKRALKKSLKKFGKMKYNRIK